jgi:glycosyltransferase involved in cell wall biosynthesis
MYAYSKLLAQKLSESKPVDFIYVQGLCGIYLLEFKQSSTPPVGINFHGLEMFQKTANFKSKLEQYLFKRPVLRSMKNADVVFSLGGKLTEIIKTNRIPSNKIIQIPIGLDDTWIRTKPLTVNSKRKFVFVGRYERRKGVEELSEVIKQLSLNEDFSFEFIGGIPAKRKIISSNVHYHGSISDVQKIKNILSEADVLICPSYSEGMPTVILEAMASGLAIIASNVGAVSEQVDSSNGILIKPGDKADLKNAMVSFIKEPEAQLLIMKQNSINKIKQSFLWECIIAKTIEEIEKVVVK